MNAHPSSLSDRERFEAWAAHEERLNLTMRDSNGHRIYADERTLAAWDAWQAARGGMASDDFKTAVLRCRYPVCKTIHPSGWGWDTSRLNEVIADHDAASGVTPMDSQAK